MKRHIYILFAMVAMLLSSCVEKDIFTFHPGDVQAPVLNNLSESEYVLEENGTFADFNFTQGSVGFSASIQYELFAVLNNDGATPKTLGKVTNAELITVDANTMNNMLIGWECAADTPVEVNFYVTANWMSNSNKPIGVAEQSNVITTTITPFYAEKTYKSIYFRGGFNAWGALDAYRLYCYKEDDNTYVGTIDFDGEGKIADHVAQGFKFADSAWGDINLGSSDTEKDAKIISLVSGGDNIFCYDAHKYYSFEVDVAGLKAYMLYGFDQMGVIGLNGNWDTDIPMTWNGYYGRFFADVEAPANTEFKVRMDSAWDSNWGLGGAKGGDNIPLAAGNYRIYFYFSNANAPTFEINADMYGQPEPTAPEPEPEPEPVTTNAWSLIGGIEGSSWDKDFYMTEADGVWTSSIVLINSEFKLRFNNAWDEPDGGNRGGDLVTLGEPFAAVSGGNNIKVPEEGYYIVVYNPTDEKITVSSMSNHWSLIGAIAGSSWDKDFFMEEISEGVWKSEKVVINGEFKIRYNMNWDEPAGGNRGGDLVALGEAFAAVSGGNNIKVPTADAEYYVTYNSKDETILVEAALPGNLWSLIGGVEGSAWDKDFYMKQLASGIWISDPVTITGEFKIRYNNNWDAPAGGNRGGALVTTGTPFTAVPGGDNIKVPTLDAKYQIVYNPAMETITINPCADNWSVIGAYESFSWDTDLFLSDKGDGVFESEVFKGGAEVKLRFNADWAVNRGGDMDTLGKAFAVVQEGANIKLPVKEGTSTFYKIIYDSKAETIVVEAAWSLIGGVEGSSWDKDFVMTGTAKGVWETTAVINNEFKIRNHSDWAINRGGELVTLGTAFAVIQEGANIKVPTANAKYKVVYDSNAETMTVTAL